MNFKAVIFDLDGTLIDSIGDLVTSMNLAMAEAGFPTHDKEGIRKRLNLGAREFVTLSMPKEHQQDEALVDKCFALYKKHYAEHVTDTTLPFDGMIECVESIRAKGIPCAVFSNKTDDFVKRLVDELFPKNTFDIVLGHIDPPGEPSLPHKPDPAGADWFASFFGAKKEEIAMIGDSDIDIKFSANSGLYGVGVAWGFCPPEILEANGAKYIASTVEELGCFLRGETE